MAAVSLTDYAAYVLWCTKDGHTSFNSYTEMPQKIEIITMGLYTQLSRSIIISVKIGCFFLLFSVAMQTLM